MKKNNLLLLIGGIVVIGLIIFFLYKNNENQDLPNLESENVGLLDEQSTGKKMSFSSFLGTQTGAYECRVTQYVDEGFSHTIEGKVWINNEKIRGDFDISVSGMNLTSSMIARDGFVYTWTSMSPIGYKAKEVKGDKEDSAGGESGTYSWNSEQIGDYDCVSWSVDDSKFVLPSSVNFQEI